MARRDIAVTAGRTDPFIPQFYQVGAVYRELPDTVTLELAPLAGPRPAFAPDYR